MDTGLLTTNNVWMMLCTALVFFMHLGFSFLEIGLTRQKNTINILFKNLFIICIGLLLYCLVGFNLMYPGDFNGFFGFAGFGLEAPLKDGALDLAYNEGYTYWTDFLFQGMFAATAATIVSGAVAERIKVNSFMVFAIIYVGIVYPIAGSWKWGGGFLDEMGFYDFAGSTLVHSVGGWAALIAIWLLGSRIGKFDENGKPKVIPGHNLPLATGGVLILWLGWFGFNGGSVLSADPALTSLTLVTTCLAAAAGGIAAFMFSQFLYKNLDLTMFLNGVLAGLVGITAGADQMGPTDSILIGIIAGMLVVGAVALVDKLRLDDPVGAVAVHLVCGIWGTLAVGIFGAMASMDQFLIQLTGVAVIGAFCIVSSFIILIVIKKTMGLRVSKEEEIEGLDEHEHGMSAYPDYRMNDN
ncbi:ammonium transporter [Flavobacterium sp. UMI-01]|uniref:ammonium transporter n=1 Tax=Flavobacterium sp. UMI-01 TaxID=1441053 RepID=UPI001C7D7F41|nr:ammonium transporter [Flavobacterium sp. UMI-01]GIZ10174.1 ammonium transporter [Flavobacterium sp. UMI-01]